MNTHDAEYLDACFCANSHASRELVELAMDGRRSVIASGYSALTVERARDHLASCIAERCPYHGGEDDALALLDRVLDEAEADDEHAGAPEHECRLFCGQCV